MQRIGLRAVLLIAGTVVFHCALAAADDGAKEGYRSPYSVHFTHPKGELIADMETGARGDFHEESRVPFRDWYSPKVQKDWGSWGPPARQYSVPALTTGKPVEWQRERAIAVALRFVGYGYQHHHVPDWDPPADWPWQQTAVGHNGKGVDCSNFVSFVYNQGFGIKPNSNIHTLSEEREIPGPGERQYRIQHIPRPQTYEEWATTLKTGDLLFIKNNRGTVSHVVLWIGPIGQSPEGLPLVLDSHGQGVKDANGMAIPSGVYLRPFRKNSWYDNSASHASRILGAK
jgi:cell wall-associated NlpC family hydrolase